MNDARVSMRVYVWVCLCVCVSVCIRCHRVPWCSGAVAAAVGCGTDSKPVRASCASSRLCLTSFAPLLSFADFASNSTQLWCSPCLSFASPLRLPSVMFRPSPLPTQRSVARVVVVDGLRPPYMCRALRAVSRSGVRCRPCLSFSRSLTVSAPPRPEPAPSAPSSSPDPLDGTQPLRWC